MASHDMKCTTKRQQVCAKRCHNGKRCHNCAIWTACFVRSSTPSLHLQAIQLHLMSCLEALLVDEVACNHMPAIRAVFMAPLAALGSTAAQAVVEAAAAEAHVEQLNRLLVNSPQVSDASSLDCCSRRPCTAASHPHCDCTCRLDIMRSASSRDVLATLDNGLLVWLSFVGHVVFRHLMWTCSLPTLTKSHRNCHDAPSLAVRPWRDRAILMRHSIGATATQMSLKHTQHLNPLCLVHNDVKQRIMPAYCTIVWSQIHIKTCQY